MRYQPGQRLRFYGRCVIIRSVFEREAGGVGYVVEDPDGTFFRAKHESLTIGSIHKEFTEKAISFQTVCSRAANLPKAKAR